jgi:hypothetical protein
MTHKIINTGQYLLIVDDSEIKGKGFRLDLKRNSVGFIDDDVYYNERKNEFKKIIAHLPLNNSPILEGVPLLPPLEDNNNEVWNQGLEAELNKLPYTKHLDDGQYNDGQLAGFEFGATWGYNKAKEKYKYTEEDIEIAIKKAVKLGNLHDPIKAVRDITYSLQQPKMPVGFKCEMEKGDYWYLENNALMKPKTTINSQGLTQWVGEYIF